MSVYLAGVALPDPAECLPGLTPTGTQHNMADSTPDYSTAAPENTRPKWSVRWDGLTYQEYRLVCEVYNVALSNKVSWTPVNDASTYLVMALADVTTPKDRGYLHFSIGFTLQAV